MSLQQKVIFITEASSGIGLVTVHEAVKRGAKVFMVGHSEDELQLLQDEMRVKGFETAYAVADVAEYDQLLVAADACVTTFGKINIWINSASLNFYQKILETSDQEAKRLFDTNFWGVANGCKIAVSLMKVEAKGVIVNVGSLQSDTALPLQSFYSASQHAIKGFTDALRRELMSENSPVSISLVLAGGANNKEVAEAIFSAEERPNQEIVLGGAAKILPTFQKFFPKLQDKVISLWYGRQKAGLDRLKLFH